MKSRTLLSALLMLATLLTLGATAHAASETESWTQEYQLGSQPLIYVRNVWGSVRVSAYDGDKVIVNATETRHARSDDDLERSRERLYLAVDHDDRQLSLEITGSKGERSWHCKRCQLEVDLEIKVPTITTLDLATVNDGEIVVDGVTGLIDAHHVNGKISIRGAQQCGELHSVNGSIRIAFAQPPLDDCDIHTVNGDMTVTLPDGAGADLAFDLHNGKVRSDFDVDALEMPATVEREGDGSGTRYRISKAMGVRVGGGGPQLEFESINGDVRIKRAP